MVAVLIIVLAVVALYLGAVSCRAGHPGLREFRGWSYAHRGLHGEGRPENSMAAFRASLEGGYGIEFDVHEISSHLHVMSIFPKGLHHFGKSIIP